MSAQKELHELHLDMQVQQERYRQLQEARRWAWALVMTELCTLCRLRFLLSEGQLAAAGE